MTKLTNKQADVVDVIVAGTGISSISNNADKIPTVTLTLGDIEPDSINGVGIEGALGKTLIVNNNITLGGTDGIAVDFGSGGTLSYGSGLSPVGSVGSVGTAATKVVSGINGQVADQIVINVVGLSLDAAGKITFRLTQSDYTDTKYFGSTTTYTPSTMAVLDVYDNTEDFSASTPTLLADDCTNVVAEAGAASETMEIYIKFVKNLVFNNGSYDQANWSWTSESKTRSGTTVNRIVENSGFVEVDDQYHFTGVTMYTSDNAILFDAGQIYVQEGTPSPAGVPGAGTVTSVDVTGNNGISVSGAPVNTSGTIVLGLGAITPTTVNSVTISGSSTPTLAVTGTTSVSGSNTGDQPSIVGISGDKSQFNNAVNDGNIVFENDVLGTPTSGTLTNCTGLPISGTTLATEVKTFLTTPTAANLYATFVVPAGSATGTGKLVFDNSPTITNPTLSTPVLGTPQSGNFSSGVFTWPVFDQDTVGNAGSATTLETSRLIGGVLFDGSSDITPTTIGIASDVADSTAYVLFSNTATGGNQPKTNPGFLYDATTNTLSVNISGSISTAVTSTNITLANSTSSGYLVFSNTATGDQPPKTNSSLQYTASTNTITANLTGNVTGNITGNVTGNVSGSSGSCTGNAATATSATSATTATNISGGSNGAIVYQSGSGTTTTLAPNSGSKKFLSQTSSVPSWGTIASTDLSDSGSLVTTTILNNFVGTSNITTLGTIGTGVWNATTISITKGGTGATTANAGLNNLLPVQTNNSGKVLQTDGVNSSWADPDTTQTPGYFSGFSMSNGSAEVTIPYNIDLNIAAGTCKDSLDQVTLTLSGTITKNINATWALGGTPGTPLGGFYTASAKTNNTWYRVFLIANSTGSIVDVGFDVSATANGLRNNAQVVSALGATNTIRYRQLGWIFWQDTTDGIAPFTQQGRRFYFKFGFPAAATALPTTTIQNVPNMAPEYCTAIGKLLVKTNTASEMYLNIATDSASLSSTPLASETYTVFQGQSGVVSRVVDFEMPVDSTGKIYYRSSLSSGSYSGSSIWQCNGWDDSINYLVGQSGTQVPWNLAGYYETTATQLSSNSQLISWTNPYDSDPTSIEVFLVYSGTTNLATEGQYTNGDIVPVTMSAQGSTTSGEFAEGVQPYTVGKNGGNRGTINIKVGANGLSILNRATGAIINVGNGSSSYSNWDIFTRCYFENEGADYTGITFWDSATGSTNSHQYASVVSDTNPEILFDFIDREVITIKPYLRSLSGTTTEGYTTSNKIYLDSLPIPVGGGAWIDTSFTNKVKVYFANSTPLFYLMNKSTKSVAAINTPSQYGLFVEVWSRPI